MTANPYAVTLSLLRVFAAFMFWQRGAQKLFGLFGGARVETFTLLWLAGAVEFLGGIVLALGFLPRSTALVLAAEIAIFYVIRHLPQGFPPAMNAQGEAACILFCIAALLVVTGPGKFSLDGAFARLRSRVVAEAVRPYVSAALGAVRILMGLLFLQHGLQKMFGMIGGRVAEFPTQTWLAGVIELLGGAGIALGLFTRPLAFIASGEMAAAFFLSHFPRGFFPLQNTGERAVLFCFFFLFLVAAGPGKWSVDGLLSRRVPHSR